MRAAELAELSTFVAIAQELSFRRAAARLNLTPSTLSHSLRSLEQRLAVQLINRTTRTVALTESGAALLAEVGPAFQAIDSAVETVNAFRDKPRGRVRLNVSRSAAAIVLAPAFARFAALFPDVTLEVVTDEGFVDIVRDGYDAGIRLHESVDRDMVGVRVSRRVKAAVVASPTYFADHPPPAHPRDLIQHSCINRRHTGASGLFRWSFEKDGEKPTISVEGPLVLDDDDLMRRAAIDGVGVAFLAESDVHLDISEGRLVRVLEEWSDDGVEFFLYYPRARQRSAALAALVEVLRVSD